MERRKEYVDVHVSVVTPTSFIDILNRMNDLRLLDFALVNFGDTEPNTFEFFVSLQRAPRDLSQDERIARQRASIAAARPSIRIKR